MNAHAKNVTVIPAKTQGPAPGQPAKKKLRVATYCRVSTDKDEQLNSFEVQKAYYTEKILSNPNWKMADIFADEGISGVSMKKRDEFKRMLRHCREGRIDMILVKSVSRFGRNTVDVMRTVRSLREKNITVLFEKENLDTSQMTSELMLAFFSAFSQSESESIRENIIRGNAMAYAQGKVSISPTMFGFRKGSDDEIAIDEEQAQVVRMIYNDYLDGMTPGDIKKKLEKLHIKTAFGRDTWNTTVILGLLQNEKYRGDALLQKTFSPSLFSERSKVNNGELTKYYVRGCLPVIVEPNIWQQVQEEIARRRAKRASTEKAKNPLEGRHRGKYALSELLVCGKCGSPYNMPNYVANIVTFDGDKERIKEMLSAIQNYEFGTGSISFDKIIPMPPELDIESSDRSKAGLRAYQDFVAAYSLGRDFSKEDFLHIPGKVEDAYLRMHSGIDRETWDLGRQAFQNNQKYRSPDWYDWRRKHWNTKWDAGGYEEGRNYSQCDKLAFQAAWQEPAPVIHKLSEMYPDIEFTHQWAEEQMVVNCGTAKYKAGVQTECEQVEGYDERKDFSVEVWYQFEHNGLPPEQEQAM